MTIKAASPEPAIRVTMLPRDTNPEGSIFGGVILSYIDQAAFVEAVRQANHKYVTIAMDAIEFHQPVYVGDIVSFWAETLRIGRSSLRTRVDVRACRRDTGATVQVTTAEVTMVAVDGDGRPRPVHGD